MSAKGKPFFRQIIAVRKKSKLAKTPNAAPVEYPATISRLPGLSRYSQQSTIRAVRGIVAIRPAKVGTFLPM